jgi:2,4-dienoyl-CoA reductase-like NADH-dependent reductase (Old Yellow Enzyme family)
MSQNQVLANSLSAPFKLPNGTLLKNRIAKAAMSETLGTAANSATDGLVRLYRRWAEGGAGLLITGNVMIDRRALGELNNVALEDERDLEILQSWASAGKLNATQIWMQINHPGKQAPRGLNAETVGPSAVPFHASLARYFATPRELTSAEVWDIIHRFARTAAIANKAGFNGVQIHAAHGYLASQFLSSHHNRRSDEWGGTPENRRRFLLEVFKAIRAATGPEFAVGVKLNSADFQKSGFSEQESVDTVCALAEAGADLIEISGGTYESPAMTGNTKYVKRESTIKREAYFLEFAEKARSAVKAPLMLTGGFRTPEGMSSAIAGGAVDIVGVARPLAIDPDAPNFLLDGKPLQHPVIPIKTGIGMIDRMSFIEIAWYERQIHHIAKGRSPRPRESALWVLFSKFLELGMNTFRMNRARS